MVSMKDIAGRCGVSVATVSKALNGHSDIGQETSNRVRQIATDMGYFPNSLARALKTNRTYNIGVLFIDEANSGLTHVYFAAVLEAFKVEAEYRGYDITFINTNVGQRTLSYYEHCRYRNMDGVVIACVDFNKTEVVELMNGKIPVVTIDYPHCNCTSVLSDNVNGINDLVTYIYNKGHRKIAYIHGQEYSSVTKDRVASFYRTLERLGVTVPDEFVRKGEYLNAERAGKETEQLLLLKEPPTCIMYSDDTALIGGMNVIQRKGLRIPQDISIAGYDGIPMTQLLRPRITTFKQDTSQIGVTAAKVLIEAIEKPKMALVERISIKGKILFGDSVGEQSEI